MSDWITQVIVLLTSIIGLVKVCIEYQVTKAKKAEAKGKSKHDKGRPAGHKTSFRK